MASTLTKTQLANLALSKLGPGGGFITDFDSDTTVQAQSARRTYDAIQGEVNEAHPWRFARRRAALAADTVKPAWGFDTQYILPVDFLRILSIEGFKIDYEVEGDRLLCNETGALNVRYLARVTDVSKFTPTFIAAFCARWAAEMCPTITKSTSKRDDLLTEYTAQLKQARRVDMFGSASEPAADGDWLLSRL